MAEEKYNNDPRTSEADRLFENQKQVLPMRDVELDEEDLEEAGAIDQTLEERQAATRHMSDFGIADKRLFPKTGYNHLDILQMARIYPEEQDPLTRIFVKDLIKSENLRPAEALALVKTSLSIADSGEGRIDEIAIAKGVGEGKSEEEKRKLGLA